MAECATRIAELIKTWRDIEENQAIGPGGASFVHISDFLLGMDVESLRVIQKYRPLASHLDLLQACVDRTDMEGTDYIGRIVSHPPRKL